MPIAALVLLGLFVIQSRGTADVGTLFGPVMLVWFATLGVLGLAQIVQNPGVLAALEPGLRVRACSGTPAGRRSWRSARSCWRSPAPRRSTPTWAISAERRSASPGSASSCPACVLNYFGQGALVLREPAALEHPFYHLVPGWALLAAGRPRHLRHHHRLAGGDLGRVLADPAGDPARLPAAHDRSGTPRPPRSARSTCRA